MTLSLKMIDEKMEMDRPMMRRPSSNLLQSAKYFLRFFMLAPSWSSSNQLGTSRKTKNDTVPNHDVQVDPSDKHIVSYTNRRHDAVLNV